MMRPLDLESRRESFLSGLQIWTLRLQNQSLMRYARKSIMESMVTSLPPLRILMRLQAGSQEDLVGLQKKNGSS